MMVFTTHHLLWGIIMYKKSVDALGRSWKFDNKFIWTALVLIGSALGYSVDNIPLELPFATKADIETIDSRIDALEQTVWGKPLELETIKLPPTPTKVNVEGY